MNCSNCGAPFDRLDAGNVAWCAYCDSRRVLTEEGFGVDGVILFGSTTDLTCPGCGDQLETAAMGDHACCACPSCFGVAIEHEPFRSAVEERRAAYSGPDQPPMPLNPAELRHRRDCPICRDEMDVHPYFGPGTTIIDSCRRCGVVWLDTGEVTAIEQAPGRR